MYIYTRTHTHTHTNTHLYTGIEIIEKLSSIYLWFRVLFTFFYVSLLTHTLTNIYTLNDSFTFSYIFFQIIFKVDLSIATVHSQ